MSEEERLKLEDAITTDTGKALIKEIKYNELMQQRVEILLKQNRELHSIIKEVREQINKDRKKYDYEKDGLMKQAFYCNKTDKLLEILDKVEEKE